MIDADAKLVEFLSRLRQAEWVAIDTEADSLHAYPEKLCLLQISIAGADELIDPLSRMDMAPLWLELRQRELIFNAADYDLRMLRKKHQFVPEKIFDTMIAARLLGEKQFGLTNLVWQFLGIKLEKGSQTANWARRPLTEKMTDYARNDTRHLKPLADVLRQKLVEKGRLSWLEESCAQLVKACATLSPPEPDPWRIRGSNKLGRPGLAVLREIWQWREVEAVAVNRPPYFIISHEVILEIAAAAGMQQPWEKLFPRHLSPHRRKKLTEAIQRGVAVAPSEYPNVERPVFGTRPTEAEKRRFETLSRYRDQAAAALEIDPTLIASRAMLGLLAQNWEKHEGELLHWQRNLLAPN